MTTTRGNDIFPRNLQLTNEEHHRLRSAERERREREYAALMLLLATTAGALR